MAKTKQNIKPTETPVDTFTRWLSDGSSWIGVFMNHDLGHYDIGRHVAFPFDVTQWDGAIVGQMRSPDHGHIGLGWRYVLVAKCKTVDEALAAFAEVR